MAIGPGIPFALHHDVHGILVLRVGSCTLVHGSASPKSLSHEVSPEFSTSRGWGVRDSDEALRVESLRGDPPTCNTTATAYGRGSGGDPDGIRQQTGSVHSDNRDNCAYLKRWTEDDVKLNWNWDDDPNPSYGSVSRGSSSYEQILRQLSEYLFMCVSSTRRACDRCVV